MTDETLTVTVDAQWAGKFVEMVDANRAGFTAQVAGMLSAMKAALVEAAGRPELPPPAGECGFVVVEVYPASRQVAGTVLWVPTIEDAQALDAPDREILRCLTP